ncbi:MAG: C25 family cysteine peptidase [Bacteroidetes bacterium]|nr:C25 family cysteine peptidase [Bacteroidota bacterium]MCL2303108.1 C25 family cysteine peptidase [Lentimicrobiaceae bacterium]
MRTIKTLLLYCALLLSFFAVNGQNFDITSPFEDSSRIIVQFNLPLGDHLSKTSDRERYLMITSPGFESTLTYFANYKRNIGFDVQVVNTNATGKAPASIKKYIQNQYNNPATRPIYVLLVGDVDSIPAYEGNSSGKIKNDPVTDLGYALLEGKNYFADVFLGRFPVENEEQLKNIINKTIFMEVNMHLFDKKAKFLAGDEKKSAWNRAYMKNSFKRGHEYVIPRSFIPLGYDCQKLYQPNKTEVINALNANPLFYIYAGHGSITSFAGKSFEFERRDLLSAKNTVFPFVFSFACKTGNFSQTCIGEHFIRERDKGAVAYFGSSINSQTNTDVIIQKKIFGDAFKQGERNLSAIINLGMKQFSSAIGASKKKKITYLKAYNLLGDPSFDIKGIINLKTDEIIHPALFSVFPNPETDDFSLAYTLESSSFVQIDLYNSSKEHVKNFLQIPQQKAGVYYYNFSLIDLPSGEYVVVYKNATKTFLSEIVKY